MYQQLTGIFGLVFAKNECARVRSVKDLSNDKVQPSVVEGFQKVEQLEKTEPGFKLRQHSYGVKGLMMAMAGANLPPQEQGKFKQEWDNAERERKSRSNRAPRFACAVARHLAAR